MAGLLKNPGAIGSHLCGAYTPNRFRRSRLIDEMEQPDEEAIREIRTANQAAARWLSEFDCSAERIARALSHDERVGR